MLNINKQNWICGMSHLISCKSHSPGKSYLVQMQITFSVTNRHQYIYSLQVLKSQNMASGVYFYTNEFGDKIEQILRKWKPVERAILKMEAQN